MRVGTTSGQEKRKLDRKVQDHASWMCSKVMYAVAWILFSTLLAAWPVERCVAGGQKGRAPAAPHQMWSRVEHDPAVSDPFFEESEKWLCPDCDSAVRSPRRLQTAKCFSTNLGTHEVPYCRAKLRGSTIGLVIEGSNTCSVDKLRIEVRNGMFTCRYSTAYEYQPFDVPLIARTSTRQRLILNKRTYTKGDVIKGRIVFECVEEVSPAVFLPDKKCVRAKPIEVYGVFKTTVE